VLLVKTALARLDRLERRIGIPIYPILGAGSVPFRGNLRPDNVGEAVDEYPSIQTFTIQSAFKYDHPEEIVRSAIAQLNETPRERAAEIDEDAVLRIADKVAQRYEACVAELAPLVNAIAPFVPPRRARKLHIGLFGYSRQLNGQSGIHLPRAIGFCASLYSLGLPPEILGLGALDRSNLAALRESYANLDTDMGDSLRLLCEENLPHLPEIVREDVRRAREWFPCKPHKEHARIAAGIWNAIAQGAPGQSLTEEITRAATYRRFLG